MEIKKNLEVSTTDFWYDLTDGCYLHPYDICKNMADAERVDNAIQILRDFQNSCENKIEDFIQ